jgi:hypothetical protein
MKKIRIITVFLLATAILFAFCSCGIIGKTPGDGEGMNSGDEQSSGEFKVKDEDFFGVTLPVPAVGTVTEKVTKENSYGMTATTIRISGLSYAQFIEYCKILEALPGWEVYEGMHPEDVAHLPEDHNLNDRNEFTGNYDKLPHIAVTYYSDKTAEKSNLPNFCMVVFRDWD